MNHELQDKWDEKLILSFYQKSIGKETMSFLNQIKVDRPSDFGAEIERLRSEGLRRLPILNKGNEGQWFFVFNRMPVSVWAARALPGCIDKFLGKTFDQKLDILKTYKTKRISYSTRNKKRDIDKKLNDAGGARLKILARSRDYSTNWNCVK